MSIEATTFDVLSQIGSAVTAGTFIDNVVPRFDQSIPLSGVPLLSVEIIGQVAVGAAFASLYVDFMSARGSGGLAGVAFAPFWVFFIASQPNLNSKIQQLSNMVFSLFMPHAISVEQP